MTTKEINNKIDEVGIAQFGCKCAPLRESLERGLPIEIEFNDGGMIVLTKYDYTISNSIDENDVIGVSINITAK